MYKVAIFSTPKPPTVLQYFSFHLQHPLLRSVLCPDTARAETMVALCKMFAPDSVG